MTAAVPSPSRGEVLHRQAVAANARGHYGVAERLLHRGLRASGDDTALQARILLTLALSEAEQGRVESSFARLDEAAAAAAAHTQLAGITHGQRGLLLLRLGRNQEALTELRRAVPLLKSQPIDQVRAYLNQGVAEKDLRRFRAAESSFQKSAELATANDHAILAGKATSNLGELAALRGDLPLAIARFDEAAEIFRDRDPILRAITVVDSAFALTLAGLFAEAESELLDAALLLGTARLRLPEAEAWLSLAEISLTEDRAADATRYARKALHSFRLRGADGGALVARAILAATAPVTRRTVARVRAQTLDVADELRERGLTEEAERLRLRLARAAIRAGLLDQAADLAGPTGRRGGSSAIHTRILAHTVHAELAHSRGDLKTQRHEVRRGLAALQQHQSRLGSFDLQTAVVRHGVDLASLGLADAVAGGRPTRVLTWLERTRSLVTRIPPVTPPEDEQMAALLESLRHQRLELSQLERHPGTDRTEVAALRRSCRELERSAGARERQLVGSGTVHAEADVPAIQASLGADGSLVSLFDLDAHVHALVLTPASAHVVDIGPAGPIVDSIRRARADLDVLALASTPGSMRIAVRGSLNRTLERIGTLVWQPVSALVEAGPVALVPTGTLAAAPWTLVPALRGRPLTVARSAGEWLRSHEWPAPLTRTSQTVFATGPRVDRANEEVLACARTWPSAQVDLLAGPSDLLAATGGADVLHVAAHGVHDADNPLFSYLELNGGLVFGHDFTRLRTPARHVVLSACDLGLATVRPGGEALGMTAALLHSGTASVIAGVARVADDVACDVAVAYHQRLSAGERPSYALAGALSETGADGTGEHLAPLTCFGAGW